MTVPLRSNYTDLVTHFAGITQAPESAYGGTIEPGRPQGSPSPTASAVTTETGQTPVNSPGNTPPTPPSTPPTPTTKPGDSYGISLGSYDPNPENYGLYQSLFSPVLSKVQEAGKGLQEATQGFLGGLGPRNVWDQEEEGILEGVLSGKRPQSEAVALGQLSYTGTGLARDAMDKITPAATELEAYKGGLSRGGALEDLLQQRTPGLTPGEQRFEANRLRGDEGYIKAQAAAEADISRLLGDLTRAQTEAQGIAQQVGADRADIAKNTKGTLTTRGGDIYGDIMQQVSEEEAKNKAAEEQYGKYLETGTLEDFAKIDPQFLMIHPEQFNTDLRRLSGEGAAAYDQVMSDPKYASIADIPPMTLTVSGKGYERLGWDSEWWKEHEKDHTANEWKAIKELARQRQKALADSGLGGERYGSKVTTGSIYGGPEQKGRYESVVTDPTTGAKAGKFSEVTPLYFGDWYQPEDLRNYTKLELRSPTRENVSTEEQRKIYNRIQDILRAIGEASNDKIQDPEMVYQSAQVMGDLDRYLADEERTFAEHRGKLLESQRDWQHLVQRARKDFKKIEDKSFMGRLKKPGQVENLLTLAPPVYSVPVMLSQSQKAQTRWRKEKNIDRKAVLDEQADFPKKKQG